MSKSVILNDFDRHNGHYFVLFQRIFLYDVAVKQLLQIIRPTSVSESTFNTL